MIKPKNSSNPPMEVMDAAKEADAEVASDLMEKLGPVLDGMKPSERKAVEASSVALATKIAGQAIARDQAMQALAVCLSAMNAYRQSRGESPIDPEAVSPMMLVSMMDDLSQDQDFLEFLSGEVEVEVEASEDEGPEMGEDDSMVESPESLMDRRSTLMGAL